MQQATDQDVVRAFQAFLAAMAAGDTDAIGHLVEDGFTLTHITGYRQPRTEWLAEMRQGSFIYHDIAERSTSVTVEGVRARVVGRTMTDATVYGSRTPGGCNLHWTTRGAAAPGRSGAPSRQTGSCLPLGACGHLAGRNDPPRKPLKCAPAAESFQNEGESGCP